MAAPTTAASPARAATQPALAVATFSATLLLSAFLLFAIQPMFAKMVLPKLGGSPGVWSVAMVFFQSALLGGYAYAHWLAGRFDVRRAALIHISLMAIVLVAALPLGIAAGFERPPAEGEALWLVALFAASVGAPFVIVAANGPLLQAWFSRSGHPQAADPYFLYAASNVGSFVALLSYPLLLEPVIGVAAQSRAWSWGFALLIAGIAACAGLVVGREAAPAGAASSGVDGAVRITVRQRAVWVLYAFLPSALLVAVTAHVSTDVAAVPLLWVVPLALFLLTFVIVFQRRPWLPHRLMVLLHGPAVAAVVLLQISPFAFNWALVLACHLVLFFVIAMVAHGELARRRPPASRLTEFYFWMSVGGVLGGLFCGLVAPLVLNSVLEYPLLVIGSLAMPLGWVARRVRPALRIATAVLACAMLVLLVASDWRKTDSIRSFFGVNRIVERADGLRILAHGSTIHGAQRVRTADGASITGAPEPLTYYFRGGALVDGIEAVRAERGSLGTVAAIGLGTGSLACASRPGENWTFYEIDPVVVRLARDPARFGFLSACGNPGIVLGDARLTLADTRDASLDLIVVDAFSSDAVPVHLLTQEAFALYRAKLKPGGAILLHISNRNLELGGVVVATAETAGMKSWLRSDASTPELDRALKMPPYVALAIRREDTLALPPEQGWKPQQRTPGQRPWTDDYADIVGAIWQKISR